MKAERLDWEFWSEDLSVGFVAIDDDHKRILAGIERYFAKNPPLARGPLT